MRPTRPLGASVTAAAVMLVGSAAGCAAPGPGPTPHAPLPTSAAPTAAGPDGRILPIARYLISPDEDRRIQAARAALIASCVKRFGLDYSPAKTSEKPDPMARRYDLTDARSAAARGYHREGDPVAGGTGPSPRELPPDVQAVLGNGRAAPGGPSAAPRPSTTAVNGTAVPEGGCFGEADDALTAGGGVIQDQPLADEINGRDYEKSLADSRVRDVFRRWSECMGKKGHPYGTPIDAVSDERWRTASPSEVEIATATADVDCKQQTDLVGVWFTVESEYQSADVRSNSAALQRIRKAIDVALANADKVAAAK
ncbi:hypothetical protein ACFY00_34735 [Kitasatospora sp. NPDC001540]|uniref:hypothetical protein n=1 Tax=Kitasatospora sp. NPDC001540 TaxID=3364014 RepID=UPI0036C992DD